MKHTVNTCSIFISMYSMLTHNWVATCCVVAQIYLTITVLAEVEVNSGGYLPSHFREVNIHRCSLTLMQIVALVRTHFFFLEAARR